MLFFIFIFYFSIYIGEEADGGGAQTVGEPRDIAGQEAPAPQHGDV